MAAEHILVSKEQYDRLTNEKKKLAENFKPPPITANVACQTQNESQMQERSQERAQERAQEQQLKERSKPQGDKQVTDVVIEGGENGLSDKQEPDGQGHGMLFPPSTQRTPGRKSHAGNEKQRDIPAASRILTSGKRTGKSSIGNKNGANTNATKRRRISKSDITSKLKFGPPGERKTAKKGGSAIKWQRL
jgi:hypothetical protein